MNRLRLVNTNRVLIYRLGSIGDAVVALPAFRMIARAFPRAERRILTNVPVSEKAAPLQTVLARTGLVHGYICYPLKTRSVSELGRVRSEIRQWGPDVLVYLAAPRGVLGAVRDMLFFRFCGIRRIIGVPLSSDLQVHRKLEDEGRYESEASRLARCVAKLGDTQLDHPESWDLALTAEESEKANSILADWSGRERFLAASIGTKAQTNDWGVENWRALAARVSTFEPQLGLVMVGSMDEVSASQSLLEEWRGPVLNTCGRLNPRESAAVIRRSVMFMGHDSGPMHLAAASGIPCVAIFSARNRPGVWFPHGPGHRVIYHQTECFGCGLDVCVEHQKKCIRSICVNEVSDAVFDLLKSGISASNA